MTFKTYLLLGVLILFVGRSCFAQIKLPTFDVELKVQQNLYPGDGGPDGTVTFFESTNFYGAAHVQINQHIAIGGFYSRSFRGMAGFSTNGDRDTYTRQAVHLQKGLDIRLSTSRAKKWMKYLAVNYCQIQLVADKESFRVADKSNAIGLRLGFMRKLSNNLYFNVIELGCTVITNDIFWFDTEPDTDFYPILDAKMGLTYNIGKRK